MTASTHTLPPTRSGQVTDHCLDWSDWHRTGDHAGGASGKLEGDHDFSLGNHFLFLKNALSAAAVFRRITRRRLRAPGDVEPE
jgi:hypothetical protein